MRDNAPVATGIIKPATQVVIPAKPPTAPSPVPPRNITSLVLEGGGVLGISYVGVLEVLEQQGIVSGITNIAGSSAGSIVAGLMACGATSTFLRAALDVNFASFLEYGTVIGAVYKLLSKQGVSSGKKFVAWYEDLLHELTGDRDITLQGVWEKTGISLTITGTNLSQRTTTYFNRLEHPDMSLAACVRISMSIPGLFAPVTLLGDTYVDGGVLDNFPIKVYHNNCLNADTLTEGTLGVALMQGCEIESRYPPVTGIISILHALYECYTVQLQKSCVDRQDWDHTIIVPCADISSVDFDISREKQEWLISSGRAAALKYLKPTGRSIYLS